MIHQRINYKLILIYTALVLFLFLIQIKEIANADDAGTVKWAMPMWATVLVIGDDDTLYIDTDGFSAFNPDGSKKWSLDIGCPGKPSIGDDGTIYLTTCDNLTALNPDGSEKWAYPIEGESGPIAIGSDGTIYLISNSKLFAIHPNGTEKWVYSDTLPGVQRFGLAIGADGTIYVNSTDLYAINPDGRRKWRKPDNRAYAPNLAIGPDGTIYTAIDGNLAAINPDGSDKWMLSFYDLGEFYPVDQAVIDTDGTIIVLGQRVLTAVHPDGIELGGHYRDDTKFGDLIAIGADRTIYVETAMYSGEPHLSAYYPKLGFENGFVKWGLDLNNYGSPSYLTLSANGVLYAITNCEWVNEACPTHLLAVHVDSAGPAKSSWPMPGHDERQTSRTDTQTTAVFSADFNSDTQNFTYLDDEFHNTQQPAYATGDWTPEGGFCTSGGLHVRVGNVDGKDIVHGMSGGWSRNFFLENKSNIALNLKYRLTTSRYDADECGEALVAIDDHVILDLAKLCGRGLDTGWQAETYYHILSEGPHELTVGAYSNKKTGPREKTDAYFDDISITIDEASPPETDCRNGMDDDGDGHVDCDDSDCLTSAYCDKPDGISANFNTCSNGFIYADDVFYNTDRPQYASGEWTESEGQSASGGLHLTLGNVDGVDIFNGISGGWRADFKLSEASEIMISLNYRLIMTRFDADECAKVLLKIDDGTVQTLEQLCGRGKDTGWQAYTFSTFLSGGSHTITLGGHINKKTGPLERADIYFDGIEIR